MDHIKQAIALNNDKKEVAKIIYKEAVQKFVNKNYKSIEDDAHTELSAIFGELWVGKRMRQDKTIVICELMAEANIAFNYANCTQGARGKFTEYAKKLVDITDRVDDKQLEAMTRQMDFVLTATKPEYFLSLEL